MRDHEPHSALPMAPVAIADVDQLYEALPQYFFAEAPRNVYWETTIACDLACRHCRAHSIVSRDRCELDWQQVEHLLEDIAELGSMLVLTGGDPLKRPDIFEIIARARAYGIPVSITPSITPNLKEATIARLKQLGVAALGVSLDGPDAAVHDGFRGVAGTFDLTLRALEWARRYQLPVQINTTVAPSTLPHLQVLHALLRDHACPPVRRWSLFFLVPVGRGQELEALDPHAVETLYGWIYDISKTAPFHVSTVEAPSFRRYALQRRISEGGDVMALRKWAVRMGLGIRDGNGVIFISHLGNVHPAGFLPLYLGNVKNARLSEIYRRTPMLKRLRDMDQLGGKCGRCRYRWLCGGSRSRAFAATGDPMASDPLCAYQPAQSGS